MAYGVMHYWPGDPGAKPIAVSTTPPCGARVAGRSTTHTTSRVTCKRCLGAVRYRAAAVERRLSSQPCLECSGSGMMRNQNLRCRTCRGVGLVVPCYDCKGTQIHTSGDRCMTCDGHRGTEPI